MKYKIWHAFVSYATSHFKIVPFQALNSHMWLVATIMDSANLECPNLFFLFQFFISGKYIEQILTMLECAVQWD